MVNQFPYEGCIVRKDLLPQTARRLLSSCRDAESSGSGSWHPEWLPATYDLSTEIQFFLEDYKVVRRLSEGRPCVDFSLDGYTLFQTWYCPIHLAPDAAPTSDVEGGRLSRSSPAISCQVKLRGQQLVGGTVAAPKP